MFRTTRMGGTFATFTASSNVRRGLQAVGFEVKKRKGFGKKREMLWGTKNAEVESQSQQFPYFYQQNAEHCQDIAIVGGGVASLFLALSLIEKGKKVTLYCKDDQVARNASGNLQGAIYPQLSDDDDRNVRFYVHAFDYALQRLNGLKQAVDFEHALTGVALYAYDEKQVKKLTKMAEIMQDDSLFQLCSAEELSEKLGVSVPNSGAFIQEGGWLSPVQLVQNGFALLEKMGLSIVLNHEVCAPQWENEKWHWQHSGETFSHEVLVLANGYSFNEFVQAQGIPLYPVRGQVSQVPTTEKLSPLKCVICYDGYLTPRSSKGLHCIGASHIRDNATTEFSLAEHQENLAKLQQNVTACDWVQELDLSGNLAKVGIRAAFRDRIPMVGAVPNFEAQKAQYANLYNLLRRKQAVEKAENFTNLYMINGLASRGLTSAPLLGELLASLIVDEPVPISEDIWQALNPNRTWMRKLLKGSRV